MKKLVFSVLILALSSPLFAQQGVAINTDGSIPAASAMLDIKSTNRGFLLPRMTTAERTAISNPANGLLVYDTDRGLIYQRDGSFWRGLLNTSHWNKSTTRDFLYNSADSIGIGTSTPDEKLGIYNGHIKMSIPSITDENLIKFNATTPLSGAWAKDQGIKFYRNNNWTGTIRHIASSNNGNSIRFSLSNTFSGDFTIDDEGHVGIGTQYPANALDMNAYGIPGETVNISDDDDPIIQLKTVGADKAFMQVSGNDFRIGTNSANTLGRVILRNGAINRLVVDETGQVGIGLESIAAKLHINSGTSNASVRIQGDNSPSLQYYQGNTFIGSIQATSTYLSVLAPNKLLRLNNNLFVDDETHRVGIGITEPEQKLHVQGTAKISTGKVLNNNDENMLPVAYATFNGDGSKRSGTANISGSWIGDDFFLEVTGVDLTNATTILTPRNATVLATYDYSGGPNQYLAFYGSSGNKLKVSFSVLIYKTN